MKKKEITKNDKPRALVNRKKVLDAAFELFATKGYAQTSVDSIAAKAKTSKGLVYYYFKSKEDILKAIFNTIIKEGEVMFRGGETMPPKKLLKQIIGYSFYFIRHQTNLFRLILAMMAQPQVVKGLSKEIQHVRIQWMKEMQGAFAALRYKNPEMEVYLLSSLFDGIALAYISMKDYPLTEVQRYLETKYGL